eukprot:COSAG02_NODE_9099_length_2331_cov_21.309465_1_plen_94_part_00
MKLRTHSSTCLFNKAEYKDDDASRSTLTSWVQECVFRGFDALLFRPARLLRAKSKQQSTKAFPPLRIGAQRRDSNYPRPAEELCTGDGGDSAE